MDDTEDRPASPPLPRGSYNLNFDDFDDSVDPFKPRGGLSNSPDKEMSNPFQTRNKMASTPPKEISNPFQTKSKMASSPPKQTMPEQLVENHDNELESSAGKSENLATNEDDFNEVPTSNKAKSPAINIKKPVKGKKKVKKKEVKKDVPEADDIDVNEENPFATKTKLGQSPPLDVDPFATKTKLGQSPPLDVDPFATKTKLGQSPPLDVDPFATKTKLGQSPPLDIDPFASKSKLGQSPPLDEDPFKTKSKVSTSPPNDSNFEMDGDPFAAKNKLSASPPEDNDYNEQPNIENESRTVEEDVQNESVDSFKTAEESPDKINRGLKTRAKSQTPPAEKPVMDSDNIQEDVEQDGGSEPPKAKPE